MQVLKSLHGLAPEYLVNEFSYAIEIVCLFTA